MKFVLSVVFMAVILFALVSADAPEVENGAMDFPGIARESCAGPSRKVQGLGMLRTKKYQCLCDVGDDDSCTCVG
uniref:U27-Sparatoxin-Hju1j_1 n=1 Tax=Heteropoda jugulans TaxID=1358901 RepID=A0A4Q8KDF8_9ARAC